MTTGLRVFLHFLSVFLAYPEEQLYSYHIPSPLQKIHSTLFSCNSKSHVWYLEVTRANVASDVGSVISECFFTVHTYKQIILTQWHHLVVKRDYGITEAIILRVTICQFNTLRSSMILDGTSSQSDLTSRWGTITLFVQNRTKGSQISTILGEGSLIFMFLITLKGIHHQHALSHFSCPHRENWWNSELNLSFFFSLSFLFLYSFQCYRCNSPFCVLITSPYLYSISLETPISISLLPLNSYASLALSTHGTRVLCSRSHI